MSAGSRSTQRLQLWERVDGWGAEVANVELLDEGVVASGTQIGVDPLAYRLDYELEARGRFVTRSLRVAAIGEGWRRSVALARDAEEGWRCEVSEEGDVDLPRPGGDVDGLDEALDCDLGLSPLTNLMPIRRHGLHERPGEVDLLCAWVSSPDLALHAYPQRYEHLGRDRRGATVRFLDRGLFPGFESELELDREGFVRVYPQLARRVGGDRPARRRI